MRENEKDIAVPETTWEMSAVSQKTSFPACCVHVPLVETEGTLKGTKGRLLFDGVVLPVRPQRVMAGRPPGTSAEFALHEPSSGTEGVSWMVMVLEEHGQGLLWLAVARFQYKELIKRGAVPTVPALV